MKVSQLLVQLLRSSGFAIAIASVAPAQVERTHVPVIVNYYSNAGLTSNSAKVDEIIAKANEILKANNAGMKLYVVKENDNATDGDAGSDGDLSAGNGFREMKDVNAAGKKEIETYKADNKTALKISFVHDSWTEDPAAGGWNFPGEPVIVLEDYAGVDQMGRALVHELAHALGNHDHSAGANDVTNPTGSGENIPADRLKKMQDNRRNIAKCSTQFDRGHPGVRDPAQKGQKTDNTGDTNDGGFLPSPAFLDLVTSSVRGLDAVDVMEARVSVDARYSGSVNALYVLAFDSDDDAGTGFPTGPFAGREFTVELTVAGGGGSYGVSAVVRDLATMSTNPLPTSSAIVDSQLHEPTGDSAFSALEFEVPKSMVGLDVTYQPGISPDEVPVGVYVVSNGLVIDSVAFDYVMDVWLREPTLQTFGNGVPTPGQPYSFAISGMNPFDSYQLFLDDTLVHSGTLDSTGSDAGSFVFPASFSELVPHFLTAQDGTTNIGYNTTCPEPTCELDDGSSDNLVGFQNGGELAWIQRFGFPDAAVTTVSSVQVAWGSAAFPGQSPGNGSPATVVVYEDPNDDGDPADAVLVALAATTVANVDTDTFQVVAIAPVGVSGLFFVGAGERHSANQYVASMDQTSVVPLAAWLFGDDTGASVNYSNPSSNQYPPQSFLSVGFPANVMVRAGCQSGPMTQSCVPGRSGVIACPCANPPAGGGLGCNNFGAGPAQSGTLDGSGLASLASDSVILSATGCNNTSLNVFFTGAGSLHPTGIPNGAGVRCVTTTLKRLYTGSASAGAISRPGLGDPSVSARSAALGVPISPGQTRHYFNIYRDPAAAGPCGNSASTVNLTNAGSITWLP